MKAQFGRYVFLQKLASGGMAEIFLARRISFGGFARFVVVKRLHKDFKAHPGYERLFLTEARICAALEHPNIVSVYDVGKLDDVYFMAMEYIDGLSVAELMHYSAQQGLPIPLSVAIRVGAAVAAALHHAHHTPNVNGEKLGIIHHDVSPPNIQLSFAGEVKLLDFGVATRVGRPAPGGRRGKFGYMAPEAINREQVDQRIDLYSLAVVLYEMTCGRRLFKGKDRDETLELAAKRNIPTPRSLDSSFPIELEDVILKGLARDPVDRFPDGQSMQRALLRVAELIDTDTSSSAMATYLRALFGARIAKRRGQLAGLARAARDGQRKAAERYHARTLTERDAEAPVSSMLPVEVQTAGALTVAVDGSVSEPDSRTTADVTAGPSRVIEEPIAAQDDAIGALESGIAATLLGNAISSPSPEPHPSIAEAALAEPDEEVEQEAAAFDVPAEEEPYSIPDAVLRDEEDWDRRLAPTRFWRRTAFSSAAAAALALGLTAWFAADSDPSTTADAERPTPEMGSLLVDSRPLGATVYDGDVRLGTTPLRRDDVPVGTVFRLRVERDGYATWRGPLAVAPHRPHPYVVVALSPLSIDPTTGSIGPSSRAMADAWASKSATAPDGGLPARRDTEL